MEDWQLIVLGGVISTVTAAIVQAWQGRQAHDRQREEFQHQRAQQNSQFDQERERAHDEWARQRAERHEREQRDVMRQLQTETFNLTFAAREIAAHNASIAEWQRDGEGGDPPVSAERQSDAARRFEAARARVYVHGASVRDAEIREHVEELIPLAETLAFTPQDRHGSPAPSLRIVNVRDDLNRRVGRILRGGPGVELIDEPTAPPEDS